MEHELNELKTLVTSCEQCLQHFLELQRLGTLEEGVQWRDASGMPTDVSDYNFITNLTQRMSLNNRFKVKDYWNRLCRFSNHGETWHLVQTHLTVVISSDIHDNEDVMKCFSGFGVWVKRHGVFECDIAGIGFTALIKLIEELQSRILTNSELTFSAVIKGLNRYANDPKCERLFKELRRLVGEFKDES